ncbi:hypothetical protein DDE05_47920 [Streptomyces cavourensis]|jgi:hypothetical protein|uniref:hypothetical protein n=1 Tax=unclassified Achromobacter TaxID=2626865 RepID=UPI000DFECFC3|nr:hypothetical protein DDE05_47920 [Streptomyces cavourensis]
MPPLRLPITPHKPPAGNRLRRLFAMLALLAGGLGAEAVQPGPCQLIHDSQVRRREQPDE